ncbi:hypothetical protein D3C76_832760 [compost metagenome]
MLLVGEHDVQRHRPYLAGGVEGLLDALRPRQVEQRVEGPVGLALDAAVGDAVAAGHRQRLEEVLALAQRAVQQRAVAGFVNGLADRALALDEEGFVALDDRLPLAVGEVLQAAALAAHLFQVEVLAVAQHHGHAPRQLAVEAGDHAGHAGEGNARGGILRRADLHVVPHRRHRQRQVGVVGQQGLAAAAALRGNRPVVGRGDAEHLQRGDLPGGAVDGREAGNLAGQLQALELVGLVERQRLVGVDRQQPGQLVGADLLRQHQRGDLFLQVHRQAEVQQGVDQRRILRLPVFRAIAGLGEVHRQVVAVAVDVGVDAARVGLEEALQARRGGRVDDFRLLAQVHRAHEAVDFQRARTDHFRQPSLGHQAQADHLAQAVAGVHVALGEQRVMEAAGLDQRHAQCVAADRHVVGQPLDRQHAAARRQAAAVAVLQPGLAAGQADRGAQGGREAESG